MGFEIFCGTMIALLVGLIVCFGGYRLFLFLLPIWGFFFGFFLGAQTLEAIFGGGFLATVTGWVVGFVVGAIFGLLAYLFYMFAVAIVAGSLGYSLGVGFMHLIGIDLNLLVWIVGIVVGVIVVVLTFRFNLQKYVIIAATALGGAAAIVGTLMFGLEGLKLASFFENPIQVALSKSPLLTIFFFIMLIAGIAVQIMTTRAWEIEAWDNRV